MNPMATKTSATDVVDYEMALTQQQIEHLTSMRFINRIDEHLNIVSGVKISSVSENGSYNTNLLLDIYYDDQQFEKLSFNLKNFTYEDIVYVARNIRSNEFILHEVDTLLSGDIE